ncbi:MsnO8 family LLM class oxidoreductase [Pseudomonas sp. SC11]|uniref:MsnO8 family LLM class oxidoreductase n=1 Tax=Pseudomonas sp. SC11 TaxID=326927 RepID=UPI00399B8648
MWAPGNEKRFDNFLTFCLERGKIVNKLIKCLAGILVTLRLNVIDQTPVHQHQSLTTAPALSLDLAIECERAGYHRYWVAEHHNSIQFAGNAPEILLTRIASATQRMRVGAGGVMLSHYSPYKVAETFALLGGLFPGRIDLGIGRAPGGNALSSHALAAPGELPESDEFPAQAAALCAFLRADFPDGHAYSSLALALSADTMPSLWMLGSGGASSHLAGQLGMGLALAQFITPRACSPSIFKDHQYAWRKAGRASAPPRLLAVAAVCAESDEEASFIAGTAVYRKLSAGKRPREALLSPSQVQQRYHQMGSAERAEYDATMAGMVVGSAQTCRRRIAQLGREFGSEEIGIVTVTHRFEDRLRSYQLLAGTCV